MELYGLGLLCDYERFLDSRGRYRSLRVMKNA